MAPPKIPSSKIIQNRKDQNFFSKYWKKYVTVEYMKFLINDPAALPIVSVFILLAELVLNVYIVQNVRYTEIDWIAYMQECEGFLNGTTNYALLKGDTGPLVYPAAFVYIYSALYYITSHGQNIKLAQYIFVGIYLLQMYLVLRLYTKSRKVPPFVLILSAFTSYRVHSIYVLRLFNDPVAVLLLYAALNLFMDRRWSLGSIMFSIAVGIKMNILLFAPALFLFYLTNLGSIKMLVQLFICGFVQLLLGAPFLLNHPWEYIKGSFDLGRVFEHKWTVNYRFLPREIFEDKMFHLGLLGIHLLLLLIFSKSFFQFFRNYARLRELQNQMIPQIKKYNQELKAKDKKKFLKAKESQNEEKLTPEQEDFLKSFEKGLQQTSGRKAPLKKEQVAIHFDQCTQLALLPLFYCNFIGIVFARSLHYQFYVWYFHSLPYLVWSTKFSKGLKFLLLGLIELCWNTYPSTNVTSVLLHICHVTILVGVGYYICLASKQGSAIATQSMNNKDNDNQQEANLQNKTK